MMVMQIWDVLTLMQIGLREVAWKNRSGRIRERYRIATTLPFQPQLRVDSGD